jgi:hypothetical protein
LGRVPAPPLDVEPIEKLTETEDIWPTQVGVTELILHAAKAE